MKYAPPDWLCVWMMNFTFEVSQMMRSIHLFCYITCNHRLFPHIVILLVNYTLW